ncbi:MAG: FCD domain-containing protein [Candidatus Hydrogenedentes bacterium]|nr:FCD domain-containing protein [Candidatus Hydrogenedentota bacterium]
MDIIEPNTDTLANSIAAQIHSDIIRSGLQEGDLFMTGDQVVERYGVSRTIAREALSQLRAIGVLKSRQRKGLLVARPDPVRLTEQWVPLYCRSENRSDFITLAQLRYTLEIGSADLAATHCTDEEIDHLALHARQFEAVAGKEGHSQSADRHDLAFHAHILQMTGNPLIEGFHRVLSHYFAASTLFDKPRDATKAIREHFMIVEAFRKRDVEMTRALLRAHLGDTIGPR